MNSNNSLCTSNIRTSNKRYFLTTMLGATLALAGGGAVAEEIVVEEKPLRSHRFPPKGDDISLKEYYTKLITKDAEIRKLFNATWESMTGENKVHLQEFSVRDMWLVKWFPFNTAWGRKNSANVETFLAIHPLRYARSHLEWVEDALIARLRVLTHHSQEDANENDIQQGVSFEFWGFEKLTMEPFKA